MDSEPAADPDFEMAMALFQAPKKTGSRALLLIVSLLLFAVFFYDTEILWLVLIVGVLLLHEAGHALAMIAFGYSDVGMFFIPGFGAVVTGRKPGAPAWQRAIMLFLGPLPGLLLGYALWGATIGWRPEWIDSAVTALVMINLFNLLPLMPLDGGQLVNLVLFSRHPVLESSFQAVAALGLLLLAYLLDAWLLGIFGGLMLITCGSTLKMARIGAAVREEWPEVPPDAAALNRVEVRDLYDRVTVALPELQQPEDAATWMTMAYNRALIVPPRLPASLAIGFAFLLSWLSFVAFLFVRVAVEGGP